MCLLDFPCKFSKLQYNSLAFVAGLYRATDEGSLPEIAQYSPYHLPLNVFTASKGSNLYLYYNTSVTCNNFSKLKRKLLFPIKRYK